MKPGRVTIQAPLEGGLEGCLEGEGGLKEGEGGRRGEGRARR